VATIALAIGAGPANAGSPTGKITVLAASSLTEAFTEIEARFERKHPDADVVLSFSSSSTLVTQVQQGAPADVVATADHATMNRLVDSGDGSPGVVFARNRLAIAVAPGNPLGIRSLADTLEPDVTLVLCAPEAPCGKYARRAYSKAGLRAPSVPTGANATDTLTKVILGEADAAVVYITDVKAADDAVDGVSIRARTNVIAEYPIDIVNSATNRVGAVNFASFVLNHRRLFRKLGFLAP
jgi:molybdate transport system substrate-binding protein